MLNTCHYMILDQMRENIITDGITSIFLIYHLIDFVQ
jgi:hypothetical protein